MLNPLCLSLCLHLTNPTPTHHLTAGVVAKYFLTCPNIFPSPDSVLGTECRWAEWAELRWTPCSLDPGPGAELLNIETITITLHVAITGVIFCMVISN